MYISGAMFIEVFLIQSCRGNPSGYNMYGGWCIYYGSMGSQVSVGSSGCTFFVEYFLELCIVTCKVIYLYIFIWSLLLGNFSIITLA